MFENSPFSRLSLWEKLNEFPPVMVRLIGRHGTGRHCLPYSKEEIAITSGLPLSRIIQIAQSLSWEDITIGEAQRFIYACGFDPTNGKHRHSQGKYAHICNLKNKGRIPRYLRTNPQWETEFLPLILLLKSHQKSSISLKKQPSPATKFAA